MDNFEKKLKKNGMLDELETIAYRLRAKHVKITFKERKTTFLSRKADAGAKMNAGRLGNKNAKIDFNQKSDEFSDVKVASETEFDGHNEPIEPPVTYYRNESDIRALINMRLDKESKNNIKSKTYVFECCSKREMSVYTAGKKIYPNDPCPCGSGKKYKKCCGRK